MNWPGDFTNKIICGDCLEVMREMPDESIDMCITSPPYWGLRDYGTEQVFGGAKDCEHEWVKKIKKWHSDRGSGPRKEVFDDSFQVKGTRDDICIKCQAWKGQLGLEPTPEMYIEHLTIIFNEAKRVLKKEGTLWLNIGDTYGGSGGAGGDYNIGGLREEQPKYKQPLKIMPKCLLMIPERLSWSLIQNGWILRNKIIWFKPNSMPSSVKDRFSNRWEVIFLFVKSSDPVYWTNGKTGQLVVKKPLGIKGIEGPDWEWREVQEWKQEEEKGYEMGSVDPHRAAMRGGLLGGGKHKKQKGKLKKVSLWTAHDYYFDLDAVREPHKYDGRKDTLYKGGPKDVQIGSHERWPDPAGKNPGDVIHTPAETRTLGAILGVKGAIKVPGGKGWIGHPPGGEHRIKHDPRWCPPEGKNPGDFLEINTQPFPEAHFAVFPEKLCERPIKAGCPEQVCKKCGKARERMVEKGEKILSSLNGRKGEPSEHFHPSDWEKVKGKGLIKACFPKYKTKTIGWTLCNCNAGFEAGIVLDPFAGAGTVGVVAKKLGRQFILIDIKKEYCEMAEKRIAQVGYQMELRV